MPPPATSSAAAPQEAAEAADAKAAAKAAAAAAAYWQGVHQHRRDKRQFMTGLAIMMLLIAALRFCTGDPLNGCFCVVVSMLIGCWLLIS